MSVTITLPRPPIGRRTAEKEEAYQAKLLTFAETIKEIDCTLDFKISSRGWCYILEKYGLPKGDFDKTQDVITDLRKRGYLPLDFVNEDVSRVAEGVEELDDPDPEVHAELLIDSLRRWITDYHREHYLFFTHDLSKISYLSCYHSFCSVKVTYAESLEPGSF